MNPNSVSGNKAKRWALYFINLIRPLFLKGLNQIMCSLLLWRPTSDGERKFNPWVTWLSAEKEEILGGDEHGFLKDYLRFCDCHSASF